MSERNGMLRVEIDGKPVSMNRFVKRVMRNTVLAILSALKGVEITGEETVEIHVRTES